ncbi:DUF1629 domain-containing protein [Brucella pituitosa]|uniref:DUF1629 domain-containing protein n=1 Tax=Brucella pituitosa TaxID=571256 RepID=UPI0012FD3C43|nr:DUF1629 domain-containing protein [Brucella pituitosa]
MVDKKVSETNPKTQSSSGNRKFYEFGPDLTGGGPGHGLEFVNEEKLLTPPRIIVQPAEGGFPVLKEKPHIAYYSELGDAPRDLEGGMSGYWFISERLKEIFEKVDPDGFAFAECDYTLPDGSIGPKHYLCDVIRTLDALDEETSVMNAPTIYPTGEKVYDFTGKTSLQFREQIVKSAHVFRLEYLKPLTICDSLLFDACGSAPKLTGIRFRDVTKL